MIGELGLAPAQRNEEAECYQFTLGERQAPRV